MNRSLQLPLSAACLLLMQQAALAGAWEAEGEFGLGMRYSDNPALQDDNRDPESTASAVGSATLIFNKADAGRTYNIEPRVTRNYYFNRDIDVPEYTNWYLDASTAKVEERLQWSLSGRASDVGVLVSEQDDVGNTRQADDKQRTLGFSPTVSWIFDPKNSLNAAFGYTKVDFERDFTGRSDYESATINLFYSHQIDERNSIGANVGYSKFESERLSNIGFYCIDPSPPPDTLDECIELIPALTLTRIGNTTDGYSGSLTYSHQWSEQTRMDFNIGLQSSDLVSSTTALELALPKTINKSTFESTQYRFTLEHSGEVEVWTVNASRSIQPSSSGTPSDKDQISTRYTRRFADNVTGFINLLYFEQTPTGPVQEETRGPTNFFRGDAQLSWRFSPKLSLVGNYSFRRRLRKEVTVVVDDQVITRPEITSTENQLTFGLTYDFDI